MSSGTMTRTARRALPLLALALACESDLTVSDVAVSLRVSPEADSVTLGGTATPFTAVALNLDGDTVRQAIRWSVGRTDIARIDSLTGTVTGLAAGQTRVTARSGSLTDTAALTVLGPVTLALRIDTILLAPGDTFTVPRTALGALGQPVVPTFAGTDPAVATISPSGFVQAIGAGRTSFTMTVDSASRTGVIDVVAVDDTLNGSVVAVLSGAIQRQVRLPSRWFQYPATSGGSVLNVAARDAGDTERIFAVLRDSLSAVGSRLVDQFPEVAATTAVCDPPNGWLVYQDRRAASVEAQSIPAAGTILVQRLDPIPGGWRVSATVDVVMNRLGGGSVSLYGRFVVPLLSLGACPG